MQVVNEVLEKSERVRQFLDAEKLEAVVLSLRRNFAWATGGASNHVRLGSEVGVASLIFLSGGSRFILAGNNEMPRMQDEEVAGLGFGPVEYDWHDTGQKQIQVDRLVGGRRYGSDVPMGDAIVIEDRLARLRYRLTRLEVARYHEVGIACAQAVEEVCQAIEPGKTEMEIEAMAAEALVRRGVRPTVLLVGVDERLFRFRHPIPTGRRLQKYAMLAANAQKYGLIASLTRFVHFGSPTEDLIRRHRAACTVFARLMHHTRAGERTPAIFDAMRNGYADVGFAEEWRHHHQGGAIGYREREWLLAPGLDEKVENPQAFAWNPTVAGAKDEDTILVTDGGPELLTFTGEWPVLEVRAEASTIARPAILVR